MSCRVLELIVPLRQCAGKQNREPVLERGQKTAGTTTVIYGNGHDLAVSIDSKKGYHGVNNESEEYVKSNKLQKYRVFLGTKCQ